MSSGPSARPLSRRRVPAGIRTSVACLAAVGILAGCNSPSASGGSAPPAGQVSAPQHPAAPLRLQAGLAPWTLPAATSRAVALADGPDIVLLGGLVSGDVSTSAIYRIDPRTGANTRAGRLALAVHDAAGALVQGRAVVFAGGSYNTVSSVQTWQSGDATITGRLPQPRSDLASATIGATTYVVGGFDGTNLVPSVLATTDGVTYRVVGTLPQPVRYPAVAALDGRIWVVGGLLGTTESNSGALTDDIQRFDPTTGITSVVGHLPEPMAHAAAFALGGRLVVAGGRSAAGASSSILAVDTTTGAVTVAGTLPGPRSDASTVSTGTTVWLLGGEVSGPTAPLDTVVEVSLGAS